MGIEEQAIEKLAAINPPDNFLIAGADRAKFLPDGGPRCEQAAVAVHNASVPALKGMLEALDKARDLVETTIRQYEVENQIALNRRHMITNLKTEYETARKRMDHALAALKRKGLYGESFADLYEIAAKKDLHKPYALLELFMEHSQYGIVRGKVIDDKTWEAAIELTMLQQEPAIFLDKSIMLAPYLEPHCDALFLNAVFMACFTTIQKRMNEQNDAMDLLNEAAEGVGGIGNLIAVAKFATVHAVAEKEQMQKSFDAKIADLQKQLAKEQERAEKAEKALRAPIERAEATAMSRVEALERELAEKNARIEVLIERLWDAKYQTQTEEKEAKLLDLPEKGVIFIGGHPNMVKHLKNRFPDWRFIDGDDRNFKDLGAPSVIFIWFEHISHPTYHRIMTFAPDACPVRYCNATNQNRLIGEMKQAWTDLTTKATQ